MKLHSLDLAKTQLLSLVTKGITTAFGIVQSVLVVRLLSRGEFGLVGLVMSIGGVIGVSQHLGIVDGAIREIAVLKSRREVGKVFWVSHLTRQLVTIPLSLGLFFLAGYIAVHFYNRPEIIPYIQIFAGVLVLQGLQDVLGATLTGMRKFVSLYVVQIVTAAINIAVFGYLTWRYDMAGYFWAIVITTAIMVGIFMVLIARELKGDLTLPTMADVRQYARRVMRVGFFMYISRIFFVVWQRLPLLMLGAVLTADQLGDLNVSLTFGSKLTIIAMALSEVNLAWMSSLFAQERKEFERVVTRNMHRVLLVMMSLTLVLMFFTPEILQYVIGSQYLPAQHIILIITVAFFLYSLTDIGTSSVFVSADRPRLRMYVYGAMTALTAGLVWYLGRTSHSVMGAAYAVLAGAVLSYLGMLWFAKREFSIRLITWQLGMFLAALVASMGWLFTNPGLIARVAVFIILVGYITYEAHRSQLLPELMLAFLPRRKRPIEVGEITVAHVKVICFAGAAFDQTVWTNRQHVMSRVATHHPVLYIEPRKWIVRQLWQVVVHPTRFLSLFKRLFWYERKGENLWVKAQWNLIPWSREVKVIAWFNHMLNRFVILMFARFLGFTSRPLVVWVYDTEATEYLSAFAGATVMYDCVDDHAAQAGVDRNPKRVQEEEEWLLERANIVTVTSKHLFTMKRKRHSNVHLVLNAGNVNLFLEAPRHTNRASLKDLQGLPHPIIGTVGTLDSYKIDFALVEKVAQEKSSWQFVFVGSSLVGQRRADMRRLSRLPNVHFLGAVPQQEVPAYVAHFDVCLIPYKASRYNEASFPLKFWEFMATGKPIVVSGVPELREYKPLVAYVKTSKDMREEIEAALAAPTTGAGERIQLAKSHTWEKRVEQLLKLVHAAVVTNI